MSGFNSSVLFALNALSPSVNCWNSGGRQQRELKLRRSLAQIVCLLFALLALGTETYAKDVSETLKPFLAKCDTLEPDNTNYVIWDADIDILHACSKFSNNEQKVKNEEKIKKILKSLETSPEAKADFLSFRLNARIEDHNKPIYRSAYKVKKGKKLSSLVSEVYNTSPSKREVVAPPVNKETNRFIDDGYVFVTSPERKAKDKCVLFIFKNGYKSDPIEQDKIKKSCIFRSLPTHFYLIPAREIKYPSFSIQSAITTEGSSLEFDLVKEGELSLELPSTLNYEVLLGSASKDDFNSISNSNVITFEHAETSKQILVETVDDQFYEGDEKLSVRIYNPSHQSEINNGSADGVIEDNDPKAILAVSDGRASEGEVLEFRISREPGVSKEPISINYSFIGGTAGNKDFDDTPGAIQFSPDELEKTISVTTFTDDASEELEEFQVVIQATEDLRILRPRATGTIKNVEGVQICWDGSEASSLAECPPKTPKTKVCWDKSVVAKSVPCPIKPIVCWDSTTVISPVTCPPKPTCVSDPAGVRNLAQTVTPKVDYIRRLSGYERIFETKGTIQPCDFAYVSVNGTYVRDIETKNLVFARANEKGEYALTFAAASMGGTQERTKATEEIRLWQQNNNEDDLQMGDHYDVDPEKIAENLAIYSSRKDPTEVRPSDLGEFVGDYVFAMIPGQNNCGFEYRYAPREIRKPEPRYEYSLRGIRKNGICHIQANGTSTFPNEEHLFFATKDDNYRDTLFTPDNTGRFNVSVPFPDSPNFYTARVYLSGRDYTGNVIISGDSHVPRNSQNQILSEAQDANSEESTKKIKKEKMKDFFTEMVKQMAERYKQCGEREKIKANNQYDDRYNDCPVKIEYTGNQYETGAIFRLNGIQKKLEEHVNLRKQIYDNNKNWEFALVLKSQYWNGPIEFATISKENVPLLHNGKISISKAKYEARKEFSAKVKFQERDSKGESETVNIDVHLKKIGFDWSELFDWIIRIGGVIAMVYGFVKWAIELRFMKFSHIMSKNRSKIFSAIIESYSGTSELIADSKNKWAYSARSVDYNELWSLRKQAGKILDYVYSTDKEEDIIAKLKKSKKSNKKVQNLPNAISST